MEPITQETVTSSIDLLEIIDCGLSGYGETLQLQQDLHRQRCLGEIPDTVLIVEHPPVITLGTRQTANKLLKSGEELARLQIEVVKTNRGGGATAHNPGQLVLYPILDLRGIGLDITEYIDTLQAIGIELLERLGVQARRKKDFPGLWVDGKKIASIGVRVCKGITTHGMAININNDLSIFDYIIPCGIDGVGMTSILKETGSEISMVDVKNILSKLLGKYFARLG